MAGKLKMARRTTMDWISVDDRLPATFERVLATDGEYVGEFSRDTRGLWTRPGTYIQDRFMAIDILYWMPLPKPPKEEAVVDISVRAGETAATVTMEVVQCKDCAFSAILGDPEENKRYCEHLGFRVEDEGFCSDWERR